MRLSFFATQTLVVCLAVQALGDTGAREWFEQTIKQAESPFAFPDARIRYRVQVGSSPDPAEVARLRNEVAGKPDHPLRQRLHELERRARFGPDESDRTLWLVSPTQWRWNCDQFPGTPDERYDDFARDSVVAWNLNAAQLNVIKTGAAPPGRDYESMYNAISADLAYMVYGGLGFGHHVDRHIVTFESNADHWHAIVERGNQSVDYVGTWNDDSNRGFVTHRELSTRVGDAQRLDSTIDFEGWRYEPELGEYVAHKVVRASSASSLPKAWIFESADAATAKSTSDLFRIPSLNSPDPVRGELSISKVYDFRPDGNSRSLVAKDGSLVQAGQATSTKSMRLVRLSGWLLLGVLVLSFLYLRWRQPRA